MDLPLRVLRYFAAAAEHGSVTAAALALHISQPSVSLAIGQMETRLGVQLFVRQHARGIALTPAGTEVLRETRKLLASADDYLTTVSGIGAEPRSRLQVGCLTYLAPRFLGRLLRDFGARHPGMEAEVREGDQEQLLHWMRHGEVEVVLTYDVLLADRFRVEKLLELPPYVLVHARHRLARHKAIHLRQIIDEPCVLLDLPISQDYFGALFGGLGLRPNVRHRSRSVESIRTLVGNGLGYSVLNQRARSMTTYDGQRLRALDLLDDAHPVQVAAVHLADFRLRAIARHFLQTCREYFAAMGGDSPTGSRAR